MFYNRRYAKTDEIIMQADNCPSNIYPFGPIVNDAMVLKMASRMSVVLGSSMDYTKSGVAAGFLLDGLPDIMDDTTIP